MAVQHGLTPELKGQLATGFTVEILYKKTDVMTSRYQKINMM